MEQNTEKITVEMTKEEFHALSYAFVHFMENAAHMLQIAAISPELRVTLPSNEELGPRIEFYTSMISPEGLLGKLHVSLCEGLLGSKQCKFHNDLFHKQENCNAVPGYFVPGPSRGM